MKNNLKEFEKAVHKETRRYKLIYTFRDIQEDRDKLDFFNN